MIYILLIIGFVFYSGFVDNIKILLSKFLTKNKMSTNNYSLKPFDCPLCLTFWLSIIYIIITNQFNLPYILLCCVNAYFANHIQLIFRYLDYLFEKLTKKIMK